jgi:hypothetical protein
MEKFINVYDNIIHPSVQDAIETLVLSPAFPWHYAKDVSSHNSKNYSPGHSHFFISTSSHAPVHSPPEKYMFFLSNILYTLGNKEGINIEHILFARCFMQLPLLNPSPYGIHIDTKIPHWVCLYYVTDSDGDTIFYENDKKTEIQRVSPKRGRITFFDGSIYHCSSKPTKNTRVVVNFDFQGWKLGKEKEN